jgi:ribose-phosphate pyrophosphokinase
VGKDPVIVSPDAGGVERARAYAKRLGGSIANIDKRRERANVSEVMHIVGEVEGRETIVLDDMIDTAGTICNAAVALQQRGAKRILACATHGVLSGNAAERLAAAPFEEVVLSDTLPIPPEARALPKVKVLSVARILGEAIKRIHHSDSVSSLFV